MNQYHIVFEDIEKFCFLTPVQKEYTLLVSKDRERHFTIYDTETKTFLGVFADNDEEAIRSFIEWYEGEPMVYDEEKYDYVPFEDFSNHFAIYNESISCDHIIAGEMNFISLSQNLFVQQINLSLTRTHPYVII